MIYRQSRQLLRRYCFFTTVTACAVIFCCGTLTVSQKTAYNIYLKKYSVMSMSGTSQKMNINIDSRNYPLALPDREILQEINALLKFTPLAPFVYLAETATNFR